MLTVKLYIQSVVFVYSQCGLCLQSVWSLVTVSVVFGNSQCGICLQSLGSLFTGNAVFVYRH